MSAWAGPALAALAALLKVVGAWLERGDAERLRRTGRLEAVASAARRVLQAVERAHDVDRAISGGGDPEWADRLRDDLAG